ncbi:ETC complex I subunit [Stakelama saccharophila]|uniref:ETC complex I subunit n=1 Tax=Stakelama saccharophila TaxID=3075605 RepID=A0ABZ0B930_9SPHN|nr:ETC complex I subunit [Stakelama sp. W311]WNO53930.1 ETC complex I subunit [Stakelama sp. W311]
MSVPAARIYQRPKNAMQSGRARTDRWVVEFEQTERQIPDPLTGWAGHANTDSQVRMTFPTLEAARAYADREGLTYHVVPAPERKLKLQAYADNFR